MKPRALPLPLGPLFSVSEARELGVSRARLRASDLRTPYYGVRSALVEPRDRYEASVRRRAAEFAIRMRDDEFFCLVAAAVLWDAPLPASAFSHSDRGVRLERPLDVGVLFPARASRVTGVRGRSIQPDLAAVRIDPVTRFRVTDPATTWAMMGALLERDDLVALGDALVREPMRRGERPALSSIDDLADALAAGRRQGAATLRAALPLIRTRARSRRETLTRLLLLDARLPEPELNWPVLLDGAVAALIDLAYPELRVGFEYEGEQHLTDPTQWAKDIRRYEMLADLGWRIIRVTKSDLGVRRAAFIARVRGALSVRDSR